jgi:hypothetical protein
VLDSLDRFFRRAWESGNLPAEVGRLWNKTELPVHDYASCKAAIRGHFIDFSYNLDWLNTPHIGARRDAEHLIIVDLIVDGRTELQRKLRESVDKIKTLLNLALNNRCKLSDFLSLAELKQVLSSRTPEDYESDEILRLTADFTMADAELLDFRQFEELWGADSAKRIKNVIDILFGECLNNEDDQQVAIKQARIWSLFTYFLAPARINENLAKELITSPAFYQLDSQAVRDYLTIIKARFYQNAEIKNTLRNAHAQFLEVTPTNSPVFWHIEEFFWDDDHELPEPRARATSQASTLRSGFETPRATELTADEASVVASLPELSIARPQARAHLLRTIRRPVTHPTTRPSAPETIVTDQGAQSPKHEPAAVVDLAINPSQTLTKPKQSTIVPSFILLGTSTALASKTLLIDSILILNILNHHGVISVSGSLANSSNAMVKSISGFCSTALHNNAFAVALTILVPSIALAVGIYFSAKQLETARAL